MPLRSTSLWEVVAQGLTDDNRRWAIERDLLLRHVTVSVVIPALNEAECIAHVLARIPSDVHEVILVDGASTDGTMEVARRVMPTVRLVQQTSRGKGAALRDGFAAATGEIIVHLDADGSTDPAEIPSFVGALLAGADYAKGTRFVQGASSTDITPLRRLGNWGFVTLTNLLFGTRFSDITYGYNALWRVHRDKLAPEIDGWAHEIVGNIRAVRHGLRVVEVASQESERIGGVAKLSTFSAGWTILLAILAERFRPVAEVPAPQTYPALAEAEPVSHSAVNALETAEAAAWHGVAVPITSDDEHVAIPIYAFDDATEPAEAQAIA